MSDDVSVRVQNNSCASTPTLDALDAIKQPTSCELVFPYGDMSEKCAKGLVFPYGNGLIHSLPLRKNHLKVLIDEIDKNFENIPLPVKTMEVSKLQQAVGTTIQWPRDAIVVAKEQPKRQQTSTTSLPPTNTTVVMNKKMANQMNTKPKPIEILHGCFKNNPIVQVVAESGHLQTGTYAFRVTLEEYARMLKKQTLDVSIITVWQLILHSMVRTRMNKCAFLNPYKILGEACQNNPEAVVSYLIDVMRLHHGNTFLIAPYLQNNNWVFLVICPRNRIVYVLDSLRKPIEKSVDTNFLLKKHVDMALMKYVKATSPPIEWIYAECNQQVDGGLVSGHYVIKWMYDFVMTKQYDLSSRADTFWKDKTPFDERTVFGIISRWTREFLSNYIKDVAV